MSYKRESIDIYTIDSKYINEDTLEPYLHEYLLDIECNRTPHGEMGDDGPIEFFCVDGKFYQVKIEIEWNRYDKRFYYEDGSCLSYCKEVTAEQILDGVRI